MAADTATTSLALLLPGTGNDDNTWGDLINAQVTQYIEDALVGRTAKSTTGGATTLTQAECRPRYLDISGTLSSDATFTVPNTKNDWIVTNNTTGAYGVLFKTASSAATTVPQGTSKELYCAANDQVLRTDRNQIGEYFYHASTGVPSGALEADGSAIPRTGYGLDLFTNIGTTHGAGNGSTTFNLPDAKTLGKFLRSRTGSVSAGTAQADSLASHTHTASAAAAGAHSHTFAATTGGISSDHTHTYSGTTGNDSPDHTHTGTTGNNSVDHTHTGTTSGASADHSHTYSGTTSNDSPDHTHSSTYAGTKSTVGSGGGASGIWAGTDTTTATTGASARHTHTYSGTSSGFSADHTHTVTTGGVSANHTHTVTTGGRSVFHQHAYSGTTSGASSDHTHNVSGTTTTAVDHTHTITVNAAGSAETRPTNLSAVLCVRL